MKRITINPRYPVDLDEPDPEYNDFPELAFMIDEHHAVTTDGYLISLVAIIPDTECPNVYRAVGEHSYIGIDDDRTVAGLSQIVERLKAISGYELITKHFRSDPHISFFVNRDCSYSNDKDDGNSVGPVNETDPNEGCDY